MKWLAEFWRDHGTKVLGQAIGFCGLLNGGDAYLTQMLTMHQHAAVSFLIFALGQLVTARGFTNSRRQP